MEFDKYKSLCLFVFWNKFLKETENIKNNVSKIISRDKVLHKVREDYAGVKQLMIHRFIRQ